MVSKLNYRRDRDLRSSPHQGRTMIQRWRCTRCGHEGTLTITGEQGNTQDGAIILRRLDIAHQETSPLCIGSIDRQRDAGGGIFMCGDLQVLDKANPTAWIYPAK